MCLVGKMSDLVEILENLVGKYACLVGIGSTEGRKLKQTTISP